MKKLLFFLANCVIFLSCKKETAETILITPPKPMKIQVEQVLNDSTLVLKWSRYSGKSFQKYRLMRTAVYLKNGLFGPVSEWIDSSSDVNHLQFNENHMPLARDISYDIYVSNDTTQNNRGFQWAANVSYQRPNSLIYGIPRDVLIDRQQQLLYVSEENRVSIMSYASGRVVASKEMPVSIGFCSLGENNGSKELYVPVNDGWLQILDAATLQLKDRIYVGGYGIGSVVAAMCKLYISSSEMSAGLYSNCIKVYDRVTRELISRFGYWDQTRLVYLEGSSVELVDLTMTSLSYYQISPAGVPIVKKEDSYSGYYLDMNIVRSFPDGSRFITSSSGTIFNKSLVFDRYIKQYANFSDFAFNSDGSIIYTAHANQKKIDVISYPALATTSSYTSAFYPYKIFRDGNLLICISKTTLNQQMTYLLVEKINL